MGLLLTRVPRRYITYDQFNTAASAVLSSSRAAEPGPDAFSAVVDAESKMSVSSGTLHFAPKAAPAAGDPGVWYTARPRASGRAIYATITPAATNTAALVGWDNGQAGALIDGIQLLATALVGAFDNGSSVVGNLTYTASAYDVLVVLRSSGKGAFMFIRASAPRTPWTLIWVGINSSFTPGYPAVQTNSATFTADDVRVIDLTGAIARDYGIATSYLPGAPAALATYTHTADFLGYFTMTTLPASGNVQVAFRKQDATNYWYVDISSAGAINLYENVAGTPTSRANGTGVANGDRITVIAAGSSIRMFAQRVQKGTTYASAANFATSTAGSVVSLGTGGVVSELAAFPRTLTIGRRL